MRDRCNSCLLLKFLSVLAGLLLTIQGLSAAAHASDANAIAQAKVTTAASKNGPVPVLLERTQTGAIIATPLLEPEFRRVGPFKVFTNKPVALLLMGPIDAEASKFGYHSVGELFEMDGRVFALAKAADARDEAPRTFVHELQLTVGLSPPILTAQAIRVGAASVALAFGIPLIASGIENPSFLTLAAGCFLTNVGMDLAVEGLEHLIARSCRIERGQFSTLTRFDLPFLSQSVQRDEHGRITDVDMIVKNHITGQWIPRKLSEEIASRSCDNALTNR